MRRFIYERSASNIRDWSLAYSFMCHTSIKLAFKENVLQNNEMTNNNVMMKKVTIM